MLPSLVGSLSSLRTKLSKLLVVPVAPPHASVASFFVCNNTGGIEILLAVDRISLILYNIFFNST